MAIKAQKNYLMIILLTLLSVILAAALSLVSGYSVVAAIGAALFFFLGLLFSVILASKRYDKTWYNARATAESVKTLTWRWMMKTEPFDQADDRLSHQKFVADLHELLIQNKSICNPIDDNEQVTSGMSQIRSLALADRINIYKQVRIEDQSKWYLKKARYNANMADRWFWAIIGIQVLALIAALVRIGKLDWNLLPTGVLATIATAALSWMQSKRFQELSSSYSLTAQEIGFIKSSVALVKTERDFSGFVGDAENAFSREHTQWQARRDMSS